MRQCHKARCGVCSKLGQSISTESREAPRVDCILVMRPGNANKEIRSLRRVMTLSQWRSCRQEEFKKQTTIAMHATQSEYMVASEAAMEAVLA
ncbi:retrotransposon protein, putative, ty1-copia subclass [Tanacetum coccineum]